MPTKEHCTSAKILLMLSWRLLLWTPCKAMFPFMYPFFIADWNPLSHFIWTPPRLILGNAELLPCHLFPILCIPRLSHWISLHKQTILCLSLWKEITFISVCCSNWKRPLQIPIPVSVSSSTVVLRVFKSSRFKLNLLLPFWPLEKKLECHALFSSCLPVDLKNVAHSHY